jgi:hypothetical protein
MLAAFTHRPETHRPAQMRPLLVHHVAQLLGVSPRTVRHLAFTGSLEGFKLQATPKIWRFWRSDIERFILRRAMKRIKDALRPPDKES